MMIDSEGNIKAVVLECSVAEDGAVTTVRNDIKTHPSKIVDISKSWLFFYGCQFSCEANPDAAHMLLERYGDYYYGVHMLVNKSTGKIYPISQDNLEYFLGSGNYDDDYQPYYEDNNGTLYSRTHYDGYHSITVNPDSSISIKKVGPAGTRFGGVMCAFGNGTLGFVDDNSWGTNGLSLLYSNNGSELLTYAPKGFVLDGGATRFDNEIVFNIFNHGIKVTQLFEESERSEYGSEEARTQTVTVSDFSVGTSFGSWSISEPKYTVSKRVEWDWGEHGYGPQGILWGDNRNLDGYYESSTNIFIGTAIAINKRTGEATDLTPLWEDFLYVIFPNEKNYYNGKSWIVYNDAAQWFDCESLQAGMVYYEIEPNCDVKNMFENIPAGEVTLTIYSYVDGTTKIGVYDIETGRQKSISTADNTPNIITIIPLN